MYTFNLTDLMAGRGGGHVNAGAVAAVAGEARLRDEPLFGGLPAEGPPSPAQRRNPRRNRYRDAMSYDDIVGTAQRDEGDSSKKRRKAYMNTGMPWRLEFIDMYGHPKPASECFGCLYRTQRNKMTVNRSDMEVIVKMLRECPAMMTPEALAVQLSEKQVEMAQRENASKSIDDPSRIPEWDPATCLDHLENHLMAPALYTRVMFGKLQRIAKFIEDKSLVRVDKHDGDECVDPQQLRCLKETVTMMQQISKNQLHNMAFYSPGAVIEEERVGGYIAQDAFRYFNTLKKRKRGFN
jgi:hypothetical protein